MAEERPKLGKYIAGKLAEKLVDAKDIQSAVRVMQEKYFKEENAVLATAFIDAYQAKDPYTTSVGKRIRTEASKYDQTKLESTVGQITEELGEDLESRVKDEIKKSFGNVRYEEIYDKINRYRLDAQGAKIDFEKDLLDAKDDEEKIREAKEKHDKRMQELEEKYDLKDTAKAMGTVEVIEESRFSVLKRDAILKGMYIPGQTIEDLVRIANS
jgi:predicted metal-dependent phosphoesterase TrpH